MELHNWVKIYAAPSDSKTEGTLLKVANVDPEVWTTVPMQGSGTFSVEAVVQTATPRNNGKVSTAAKSGFSLESEIRFSNLPISQKNYSKKLS